MKHTRGRWSHPVLNTPGSRLIDVCVEFPEGQASLFRLNEIIKHYQTVTLFERTKRLPTRSGRWDYSTAEITLWVLRDEIKPFMRELKALEADGFRVNVNNIMTTPEPLGDEQDEDPSRRWINS